MSQAAPAADTSPPVSLDHTLHRLLSHLAPARVAAMLVLVHHSDVSNGGQSQVPAKAMMEASRDLGKALKTLKNLEDDDLGALNLTLTDELRKSSATLEQALAEIAQIMSRCSVGDEGDLKGFQPGAEMYDLCCKRVAQGVADFSEALSAFFLEQTDKSKADTLEVTSTIAMEIGKIGRVINMVATNATIEAARAGDAGKGFTVIADEVKVLSSRVSSLSVSLADRLT